MELEKMTKMGTGRPQGYFKIHMRDEEGCARVMVVV
jgi:hypothetical protein